MIESTNHPSEAVKYFIVTVASFLVLQSLLVVMHEFTHSTVAWLLGAMPNPLDIVWGNPIMMTGWDEGVEYSKLFADGHNIKAAIIGVSPLIVHTTIVVAGLFLLQKSWAQNHKWGFHALYWFTVANFMELIAYIWMRPFATHGDTGIFNRGLGLSPWFLFILGAAAILIGLAVFYHRIVPQAMAMFAGQNRAIAWTILTLSAFIMFLWGSGIRVLAYVPDLSRLFGLTGVAAFVVTLIIFRPGRDRIVSR